MYMSKLKKGKNKFGLKQIASLVHLKKKKKVAKISVHTTVYGTNRYIELKYQCTDICPTRAEATSKQKRHFPDRFSAGFTLRFQKLTHKGQVLDVILMKTAIYC